MGERYQMPRYAIRTDDLTNADVLALLDTHLAEMHRWSPECKVHAMPAERLRADDITFYSAWDGERLAAVGALKELGDGRAEIKSMRASPGYRGKGAARAILDFLIAEAQARKMRWLGLETGNTLEFEPAHALYARNGFTPCPPFGDYVSDDFSICMERYL
ncbi:GNAT family N-acetyltransferase [Tsuneonella mangrovi]|uniref:GNAT family N-acetyltransferase n=1 Tax=Tsuneonella mangrovi TaxID=1982042 RepID=UPI001F0A9426|nr:GNAT family N-acetyltransferase [Tsuneonella mangrovi]